MSEHTPKPWHLETHIPPGSADDNLVIMGDERELPLATLDPDDEEAEANGTLMAAAPDLFEAAEDFLEQFLTYIGDDDAELPDPTRLGEAIAKAKGAEA